MKEAAFITITFVLLFLLVGVMYNLAAPYLEKLGVIDKDEVERLQSDGGIFRSLDFARSWDQSISGQGSFLRSDIFDIKFDSTSKIVYTATSEGLYQTKDLGETWNKIYGGDLKQEDIVRSFAKDSINFQRMYVASYSGGQGHILKSRGGDFYEVYSTSSKGDIVSGVWIDPFDSTIIYSATGEGLFLKSIDFGESWRVEKNFRGSLNDIVISQNNKQLMFAVVGNNKIFKSDDKGKSWQDISSGISRYGKDFLINKFVIDPNNDNILYLASSVGFLKSKNMGSSFFKMDLIADGDSPNISIASIGPKNSKVIYLGVGNRIHKSDDGGINWQIKTLNTVRNVSEIWVNPDDSKVIFVGLRN